MTTTTDRGQRAGKRYALKALRRALGKTQVDVARAAKMSQSDVSHLEDRSDVKVSTLVRYLSALGGSADIAVVVGGRRYRIALASGQIPSPRSTAESVSK